MCLPIIGVAISGIGTVASAMAQASQANYAAKVAEINARTARQVGLANADAKEDEYQALRGRQRVQAAASGVRGNVGSASLIIDDKAYRDEYLDTANIIWKSETEAVGHENQARQHRAQAKSAIVSGIIGGASTIVGGMSKVGSTIKIA